MVRTYGRDAFLPDDVAAAKLGRTVTVCIPARNEAATVARVVEAVRQADALVDDVIVVDDASEDGTAGAAAAAGARVVRLDTHTGKGGAMRAGVEDSSGEFVLFLDADVENTTAGFVTRLLGPVLIGDAMLSKGYYERPLGGAPSGGGRVNELMARPLLEVLFPSLADVRQPLAGETAAPRAVLEKVGLAARYGVEIGLLIDVAAEFGADSVAQVDLGTRVHRNRSLDELRPQAVEVLRAALVRQQPR